LKLTGIKRLYDNRYSKLRRVCLTQDSMHVIEPNLHVQLNR